MLRMERTPQFELKPMDQYISNLLVTNSKILWLSGTAWGLYTLFDPSNIYHQLEAISMLGEFLYMRMHGDALEGSVPDKEEFPLDAIWSMSSCPSEYSELFKNLLDIFVHSSFWKRGTAEESDQIARRQVPLIPCIKEIDSFFNHTTKAVTGNFKNLGNLICFENFFYTQGRQTSA